MRLAGLCVESDSNHSVGEEEIKVSGEVAVNINIWINEEGVNFIIHNAVVHVPCERCVNVPVETSVPVSVEIAEVFGPVLLEGGNTGPGLRV